MKFIIKILLLILLPTVLMSQRIITKDTTYFTTQNNLFYQTRIIEYNTGESNTNVELVGNAPTLSHQYVNTMASRANGMAQAVRDVWRTDDDLTELGRLAIAVGNLVGDTLNPLTLIGQSYAPLFSNNTFNMEDVVGATNDVITFSYSGTGQLRYDVSGQPQRNAFILGQAIILMNYKGQGRLDIFKYSNTEYRDIGEDYILTISPI